VGLLINMFFMKIMIMVFVILVLNGCANSPGYFNKSDKYTVKYYKIYGDCIGDSVNFDIQDDLIEMGWELITASNKRIYPRVTFRKYYINTIGKEETFNWRFEWRDYRWLNVRVGWSEADYKSFKKGKHTKKDSLYWEVREVLESYCSLRDTLIVKEEYYSLPLD